MDVVAGVFTDGDLVLACRRHADREAGGYWEFPGGKLEPGEEPEAALARELAEELAVEIEVGELLNRSTTVVDGTTITLRCYFVRPLGPAPTSSTDHDLVSWVPREGLIWLPWAPPDRPTVRQLVFACDAR